MRFAVLAVTLPAVHCFAEARTGKRHFLRKLNLCFAGTDECTLDLLLIESHFVHPHAIAYLFTYDCKNSIAYLDNDVNRKHFNYYLPSRFTYIITYLRLFFDKSIGLHCRHCKQITFMVE